VKMTIKSALGTQVGIGFFANDHLHLSATLKVTSVQATINGSNYNADLKTGRMTGVEFQLGYLF